MFAVAHVATLLATTPLLLRLCNITINNAIYPMFGIASNDDPSPRRDASADRLPVVSRTQYKTCASRARILPDITTYQLRNCDKSRPIRTTGYSWCYSPVRSFPNRYSVRSALSFPSSGGIAPTSYEEAQARQFVVHVRTISNYILCPIQYKTGRSFHLCCGEEHVLVGMTPGKFQTRRHRRSTIIKVARPVSDV